MQMKNTKKKEQKIKYELINEKINWVDPNTIFPPDGYSTFRYNDKKFKALEHSIEEYGITLPIHVDIDTNMVFMGYGERRRKISANLNWMCPVFFYKKIIEIN